MNWNRKSIRSRFTASLCAALLLPYGPGFAAQGQTATPAQQQAPRVSNDQLDSLVAPIALYPDPLLAQVLAASTYPLEIVQLQQWLDRNPNLKDQALAAAVEKQAWDPSVQAMAGLPDVVKRMADDVRWTADLGNAFLAQQSDVMEAVQRMRQKASAAGNLKSTEQQKVVTQVVETKQVIVIQQANPQVVYVPSYNPVVVWGPPIYPYPPIYYPPVGYYAAGVAIGFGVGVAMGAFWGGGGWGWGCGWGGGNVNINVNNRYVNHYNRTNVNNRINNGNWNHNPQHRGGTPYADRNTANRFGGTARGDSLATRQTSARQNQAGTARQPSAGAANRAGAATGAGNLGADRGGATASTANRGGSRAGTADRVGNRSIPSGAGSRNNNAFGGASSGRATSGAARTSSQRGAASVGRSRAGGGGGGGRRR